MSGKKVVLDISSNMSRSQVPVVLLPSFFFDSSFLRTWRSSLGGFIQLWYFPFPLNPVFASFPPLLFPLKDCRDRRVRLLSVPFPLSLDFEILFLTLFFLPMFSSPGRVCAYAEPVPVSSPSLSRPFFFIGVFFFGPFRWSRFAAQV